MEHEEYSSLQDISDHEAVALCHKLRLRLLEIVSQTGGHLASNLGVVELTVALHRVFDTKCDRLLFDVGHQCYIHKILTGRNFKMETIRSFGGLAGFPKPAESVHDAFVAGHASGAVSVALGMAMARSRLEKQYHVIALLGDGALTGGLAYEGLSSAGQSGEPLIVILNDNGMSITKNISGVSKHLARQRLKPQYFRIKKCYRKMMKATPPGRAFYHMTHKMKMGIKAALLPSSFFEDMGFHYMGPLDGHDVATLTRVFQQAKEIHAPVLIHVKTIKGMGYEPAERNPDAFHGIAPFHRENGTPLSPPKATHFSSVFGETLCSLAQIREDLFAITAAMEPGTGLTQFAKAFPHRFFDVGIAEGHAVTMAAGMAKEGLRPIFAVYSSFLQRGYDMLLHDVAIQKLPVVFCVDRAGLVGDDGETHHGIFDYAFLRTIPGMTILAPSSHKELSSMLRHALDLRAVNPGPVAIRYPRGSEGIYQDDSSDLSETLLGEGSDITLVGHGSMISILLDVYKNLSLEGIGADLIKLNRLNPLDCRLVVNSVKKTGRLLVAEELISMGCVGEQIFVRLMEQGITLGASALCNCGGGFIPHGSLSQLHRLCGLDADSLIKKAKELCENGR